MIDVKHVYKNFGTNRVLNDVSCHIKQGEKVVIIGPSGSGKSTLLRCINLLEEPTYGEVYLSEQLLTEPDPYLYPELIKTAKTFLKLVDSGFSEDEADLARQEGLIPVGLGKRILRTETISTFVLGALVYELELG